MTTDGPAPGDYVVLREGTTEPTRVLITRVAPSGALHTMSATFACADAEERFVAEALAIAAPSGARTFHRQEDGAYRLVTGPLSESHAVLRREGWRRRRCDPECDRAAPQE